ncbi:MAG TPA: hypothetical protein PKA83_12050 [Pirellulaceae bacterium]|nr:hypothetical protein [Pirellulaceae bacterium]
MIGGTPGVGVLGLVGSFMSENLGLKVKLAYQNRQQVTFDQHHKTPLG